MYIYIHIHACIYACTVYSTVVGSYYNAHCATVGPGICRGTRRRMLTLAVGAPTGTRVVSRESSSESSCVILAEIHLWPCAHSFVFFSSRLRRWPWTTLARRISLRSSSAAWSARIRKSAARSSSVSLSSPANARLHNAVANTDVCPLHAPASCVLPATRPTGLWQRYTIARHQA